MQRIRADSVTYRLFFVGFLWRKLGGEKRQKTLKSLTWKACVIMMCHPINHLADTYMKHVFTLKHVQFYCTVLIFADFQQDL